MTSNESISSEVERAATYTNAKAVVQGYFEAKTNQYSSDIESSTRPRKKYKEFEDAHPETVAHDAEDKRAIWK